MIKLVKRLFFFYPLLLGFDLSRQVVDIIIGHIRWSDRVLSQENNKKVISERLVTLYTLYINHRIKESR